MKYNTTTLVEEGMNDPKNFEREFTCRADLLKFTQGQILAWKRDRGFVPKALLKRYDKYFDRQVKEEL